MEDQSVVPVLVASRTGYRNLCRLITKAQLRSPKGESRIAWHELPEFAEGLIALTGDQEGPLFQAISRGDRAAAELSVKSLVCAFGAGNVYVELQRHLLQDDDRIVTGLVQLAEAQELPPLATNGVQYAQKWGRYVQDVFTCLRHHTNLDGAGLLLSANGERRIKSPRVMAELFRDLPEAILNTQRLADRLDFSLDDLGYEFPRFPVADGETMESTLRKLTLFGAQQRYGSLAVPVRSQLDKELELIFKLGFSGYFLIVWDIVNFAREKNILVQGRGSAANSAVCYALGITAVDPIGQRLLFERFLTEARKGWPDIDLDLPSGERREQVIQEVFHRYGRHGAAMTANVITYRGRSAVREIGKALGFTEDVLKRFSDLFASGDFEHTMELQEQVQKAGIPPTHPRFKPLIELYRRVYGLPRHLGQHSGGMVICQGRLDQVVPLENASMPGRTVVQWDKDDCEDLGIIKVDLLGLGMMAVLQDAVELTHRHGRGVDLAHIDKEDVETFELMQKADTVGTFQVESRAQMATLPRMKPACFYDVAIEVAIIRPGPIVGQMVHPYLARRSGEQEVEYIHPDLKPILERTLGVPLFQEQMLRIAMIMADFSGDEAEELRRALSFHRSEERMEKVIAKMKANMTKKGIAAPIQERIVQASGSFALYGFPESHAISFALLAYASCWLKVHRAPEFYCGLLNNQPMGFYSPATLMADGKRRGLKFRPVCIERSDVLCRIEDDWSIRLGLNYVVGLRREKASEVVRQRGIRPFASLGDLLTRVKLSKGDRRTLAKIGAFNGLSSHRRAAQWDAEALYDTEDLFSVSTSAEIPPLQMMTPAERLNADYNGTGVTTGPHPIALVRDQLPHLHRAKDLSTLQHGQAVTVGGVVICRQRPGTAKGHVFISLEDETGIANAIVRSELFEKLRLTITHESYLEIAGTLQHLEGVVSVLAKDVRALDVKHRVATQSYDFR
jgi:error-prone DNA polymerase